MTFRFIVYLTFITCRTHLSGRAEYNVTASDNTVVDARTAGDDIDVTA